ncbi:MAG: lipoyl(octanoyl) transferase LipB [Dehalococcoidia bacterium]|nr:MAG: lipoyl(octanoyl) transferase LipB [Dehalococcoidia bacterium]
MNGIPSVELLIHAGRRRVPYASSLAWMLSRAEAVRCGGPEVVALLEHDPVYTLGARAARTSLRVAEAALLAPLVEADRGGDVTWHGPGQVVLYPVLDLRARGLRAGDYVRALESVAIETLVAWGIAGGRMAGRPGVWVDGAKVAAVGVRIDRGVSRHGLALNVSPDLAWFDAIVPCGLADAEVTSMARLLGEAPSLPAVAEAMAAAFARVLGVTLVEAVPA